MPTVDRDDVTIHYEVRGNGPAILPEVGQAFSADVNVQSYSTEGRALLDSQARSNVTRINDEP
jgi:hypothetical protein